MDDTIFNAIVQSEPLPVDHEYSRGAERCRRKACMGWSWAAACGAQGGGILRGFLHSLLQLNYKALNDLRHIAHDLFYMKKIHSQI